VLYLAKFIIGLLNLLIKALGEVLSFIFAILPSSPFAFISNSPISSFLGTINYFIPVSEMILISESWLLCVGSFYLYQIVLRWVKAIE